MTADFLKRYLRRFYRRELRDLAKVVIQGRQSALARGLWQPAFPLGLNMPGNLPTSLLRITAIRIGAEYLPL